MTDDWFEFPQWVGWVVIAMIAILAVFAIYARIQWGSPSWD